MGSAEGTVAAAVAFAAPRAADVLARAGLFAVSFLGEDFLAAALDLPVVFRAVAPVVLLLLVLTVAFLFGFLVAFMGVLLVISS
jgi:hypothetical protein